MAFDCELSVCNASAGKCFCDLNLRFHDLENVTGRHVDLVLSTYDEFG